MNRHQINTYRLEKLNVLLNMCYYVLAILAKSSTTRSAALHGATAEFLVYYACSDNNLKGSHYRVDTTGKFQDRNVIQFGDHMAGIRNPIVTAFTTWPVCRYSSSSLVGTCSLHWYMRMQPVATKLSHIVNTSDKVTFFFSCTMLPVFESLSNKNLAIANRSRVSCAHNSSKASPWPWNLR